MRMTERTIEERSGYAIGWQAEGGACYPPRHYFVRLPGGMRHHFESEAEARTSQYWPFA
jgi:hypothetical protein